ncbi:hypothetical protein Pcinc_039282 [Petrolisthes cinctipes]|uniref:Uncharacterized protein n=1 Tax=Petrolisthes cinctipes TaxID=88211 RepID=A0AAE1BQ57_PETCI|nr:hypothetical protein Pcinc_039282 [Petrolisthes cinctipes]
MEGKYKQTQTLLPVRKGSSSFRLVQIMMLCRVDNPKTTRHSLPLHPYPTPHSIPLYHYLTPSSFLLRPKDNPSLLASTPLPNTSLHTLIPLPNLFFLPAQTQRQPVTPCLYTPTQHLTPYPYTTT